MYMTRQNSTGSANGGTTPAGNSGKPKGALAKQKPGADNNETLNDGPAADAACGSCSETVTKKYRALQCDLCQLWHHIECETVSNQMYRLIQEMANEDNASCLHWYCRKCNIIAKGFMSGMTQLQERQTVLEDKVVQLE